MDDLVIFTHDIMKAHDNGFAHPENPQRIKVIMDMLACEFSNVSIEKAYPARDEDVLLAHPQNYLDFILDNIPFEGYYPIDPDTSLSPQSFEAAMVAVGASIQAVKSVAEGNSRSAFALIRPPGHHAEYSKAMGFCLFSNAFIAACHSKKRTLIIDFDVHHGNGTEDLVKRRVQTGLYDIAYASTHQAGIFPNTGMIDSDNICNCPLLSGSGSQDFRKVVMNKIIPFAIHFKPEIIIFSAGFDGHESDDIAGLNLVHEDFGWIVEQAKLICPKIISILEGGYNLQTLPTSVKYHLKALAKS